jgi:thioredoxin 1
MSKKLVDQDFQKNVLEAKGVVVIDFWASWCGPCKVLGPVIDEISDELQDRATIFKLNVDEETETAIKLNIRGLPTVVILKNGQEVDRIVGSMPKEVIKKAITDKLID